jgi:hypothetical protein
MGAVVLLCMRIGAQQQCQREDARKELHRRWKGSARDDRGQDANGVIFVLTSCCDSPEVRDLLSPKVKQISCNVLHRDGTILSLNIAMLGEGDTLEKMAQLREPIGRTNERKISAGAPQPCRSWRAVNSLQRSRSGRECNSRPMIAKAL